MSFTSLLKNKLVPHGRRTRSIRSGPLRGLRLSLDLKYQSQVWAGLYEREIYGWLTTLTRDIVTAFDIGSAEGIYTSYLLLKTPVRRVWSCDGQPEFEELIAQNLALNGFQDKQRWIHIPRYVDRHFAFISLCNEIAFPCLMKIDVEGAELEAIMAAKEVAAGRDVRWIVETHSPELEDQCSRALSELGCRVQMIPNAWWRIVLPETRPIPHNRWLVAYPDPSCS